MEFQSIQAAIDSLRSTPPPPPPEHQSPDWRLRDDHLGSVDPKLEIAWGAFHQGFWSSVAALFGPWAGKNTLDASPFRDSWVERRIPKRAVLAAALWHIAILALPFSLLTGVRHTNPLLQNLQVIWKGPIDDLPLLETVHETPKAAPKPKLHEIKPEDMPQPSVDAFHPRQRIFTDP